MQSAVARRPLHWERSMPVCVSGRNIWSWESNTEYIDQSTSNTVPRCTLPQPDNPFFNEALDTKRYKYSPTKRQCFSILLDKATFSPTSVQAGDVNWIFAKSALTLTTLPPVDVDPMLIRRSSFLTSLETLVCFLSSVLTPRRRRRRKREISSSRRRIIEFITRAWNGERTRINLWQLSNTTQHLSD